MADKIVVQKQNHANLVLGCDTGISMELSEFFSFFVPGYKFMPAYKNRVWDGKVRLYNQNNGELPVGLFYYLKEFAAKRGYAIEEIPGPFGLASDTNKINPKEIMDFAKQLNLHGGGKPIDIRDYQFNAVCQGIHKKRAILLSPTGSGKSLIIYTLMRWYLENHKERVLIIVPTTSLVEQMHNDFRDYSSDDPEFDVDNICHKIYSGKEKFDIDQRVFISTWQSIYKLPGKWFEQFGAVFGDECHGFKSKSLTSIMNKCRLAQYRFGTTGTLDGSQTHQLVLEGLFGKVYNVTTTKKLQDEGTLAPLEIFMLRLRHPEHIRQDFGKKDYQTELDYIVKHQERNRFIRNLALDQKGNTLVLFQFVEKHGQPLYDMIKKDAEKDRRVFFVHGDVDTSDREYIRQITEKQKDAIIVASLGTFSTGINIKNLHNIIFASPSKSQIRVIQSIGRGLRKSEGGETTRLYDISDDLSHGNRKNYTLLHGFERQKMYENQKFEYKIYTIDLGE